MKFLNFLKILEKIKIDKEQKNLIKLKKALYLIKVSEIIMKQEIIK